MAEVLVLKQLTAVKVCDGTPDAAREPAPRNFSKTAFTGFAKDNDVRMTSPTHISPFDPEEWLDSEPRTRATEESAITHPNNRGTDFFH